MCTQQLRQFMILVNTLRLETTFIISITVLHTTTFIGDNCTSWQCYAQWTQLMDHIQGPKIRYLKHVGCFPLKDDKCQPRTTIDLYESRTHCINPISDGAVPVNPQQLSEMFWQGLLQPTPTGMYSGGR
jgi:hypothetical protein